MKLPWRSRQRAPATAIRDEPEVHEPPVVTYTSPGFEAAIARLPPRPSCRILDLGPAVDSNVVVLGELADLLYIADIGCQNEAMRRGSGRTVERGLEVVRGLLSDREGSFQLVLAWDLFNYLSTDRVSELVELLAALCDSTGQMLATICESDTMPAVPSRHRIVGESRIVAETLTTDLTGAPQVPPAEVERIFGGFRIEHTFVLRHGTREYLARRKP